MLQDVVLCLLIAASPCLASVSISPTGSLIRNEPQIATATRHQFDDDEKGCEERVIIMGNWCEETCVKSDNLVVEALHTTAGTCSSNGFDVFKVDFEPFIFASKDSDLHDQAGPDFTLGTDCNAYYRVNNGLCETFCVGKEGGDIMHFAEERTGVKKGTCASSNFPKFVGKKKMSVYMKSAEALLQEHRFDDDVKGCVPQYIVEGNWCEETCVPFEDPVAVHLQSNTGTCKSQGFDTLKTDFEPFMFAAQSSDLHDQAGPDFTLGADCNAHYRVNQNLCETFCVKGDELVHFAETRTGVAKGTCADSGNILCHMTGLMCSNFPKFVGKKKMSVYFKSTDA